MSELAASLVRPLVHDRVDIVGDVHGELDALRSLLARLGCDVERARVDRPLVFVGDLVDRGPDSVAVVELVQHLVAQGVAQLVLGNHELNVLQGFEREGNDWFQPHALREEGFHDHHSGQRVPFASRSATLVERERIRAFLCSSPIALESPGLRVVHAAWIPAAIEAARAAPDLPSFLQLKAAGVDVLDTPEDLPGPDVLSNPSRPMAFVPAHAAYWLAQQNGSPAKVLTAGPERIIAAGTSPRFSSGSWRVLDRDRWWEHDGEERPVVFGHYWRRRPGSPPGSPGDTLYGIDPLAWFGDRRQAFCVDYSVGRRFAARHHGRNPHANAGLAALRWPERTLWFDDLAQPMATRG